MSIVAGKSARESAITAALRRIRFDLICFEANLMIKMGPILTMASFDVAEAFGYLNIGAKRGVKSDGK
jgi:hypothetical protein